MRIKVLATNIWETGADSVFGSLGGFAFITTFHVNLGKVHSVRMCL